MARPIYIAVEGVIGVGKTTLTRLLQPDYSAELVLEVFEENPFLPLFYRDPERYGFQTQIVFLLSRYHQQRAVEQRAGRAPLLSDYLFAKDRLFARLNLEGDEWETYERLHEALAERIVQPDLVIYLRAEVDTLMARIAQRDRPYERTMPRDYISRLAQSYESFFSRYEATPLVTIDTDDLNVLSSEEDLVRIRQRVRDAVNEGLYQQRLPLLDEETAPEPALRAAPPRPALPSSELPAEALLAYLRLQEETSALAAALRMQVERSSEAALLPESLLRVHQQLVELAAQMGIELASGTPMKG